MSMPGVQIPHWAPPVSRNAAWSVVQGAIRVQPLDRLDAPPAHLAQRDEARVHHRAVEQDRAGAALALPAAFLGAGQAQVLAQHVEQAPHAGRLDLGRDAVDREPIGHARDSALMPGGPGGAESVSAARTRSEVAGRSVIHTPMASWMAATIAGATTSMGSSPTPFAPCGAPAVRMLEQDRRDPRRVHGGRNEVRGQPIVLVAAVDQLELLDRGVAHRLERAALHLALGQHLVDDPPDRRRR